MPYNLKPSPTKHQVLGNPVGVHAHHNGFIRSQLPKRFRVNSPGLDGLIPSELMNSHVRWAVRVQEYGSDAIGKGVVDTGVWIFQVAVLG